MKLDKNEKMISKQLKSFQPENALTMRFIFVVHYICSKDEDVYRGNQIRSGVLNNDWV